ncbi:hypothetical protein PG984_007072 [Apiospora sp. TS-2023a]
MPGGRKFNQYEMFDRYGQIAQLQPDYDEEESSGDEEIKQETGDHKVKREASKTPGPSNSVKHESQDDKTVIKQEAYDWDAEKRRAIERLRHLGVEEVPANTVSHVDNLQGQLYMLHHTGPMHERQYSFFAYVGNDILARVDNVNDEMEKAVYHLAAIHFGQALGWTRPDEHNLEVSSLEMPGVNSGSNAVKISAPKN